jgi:hypothetical protein
MSAQDMLMVHIKVIQQLSQIINQKLNKKLMLNLKKNLIKGLTMLNVNKYTFKISVLIALSASLNASSPTKIQTQNFIIDKASKVGQELIIKECLIKKIQGKEITGGKVNNNNFINLKYFDPESLEIESGNVIILHTTGRKNLVYVDYNRGEYVDTRSFIDFKVSSPKIFHHSCVLIACVSLHSFGTFNKGGFS